MTQGESIDRLIVAYDKVQQLKGPPPPGPPSVGESLASGMEWVTRMLDDMGIENGVEQCTWVAEHQSGLIVPRLGFFYRNGELTLTHALQAAVGGGFATGLWTGFLVGKDGTDG